MLQCIVIVPWVLKERTLYKPISPLFPSLIPLHGYRLEDHPRDQYSEYPPIHLISRSIRNPAL